MDRFVKWFKIAVATLIGLVFVEQLSFERMSESPRAAHDEFWRAVLFSVHQNQRFWPAVIHAVFMAVVLVAMLYVIFQTLLTWRERLRGRLRPQHHDESRPL